MTSRAATAVIETDRLFLRQWREEDLALFAAMNADPRVMEHFPKPMSREESARFLQVVRKRQAKDGFCFWPVEAPGVSSFLGFVGLARPHFETHFTPCVEIGWRLAHDHWGQGYATEAALGALNYGFDTLGLDEIVSFTTSGNARSRAVMERIGMTRRPTDDFEHPGLPAGHPLRPHVLYRLSRPDWRLSLA